MARLPTGAVLLLLSSLLLGSFFLLAGIGTASAQERRVALVIGNSKYQNPNLALTNPANDAQDVAAALKELGFAEVVVVSDTSVRQMDMALKRFGDLASTAHVALFYYAGHAMQYQGVNYLMPVDATLEDEFDLRRSMVADEQIRTALSRTKGTKIIILDSCRNNPLAERFYQRGGRAVEAVRGLARIDQRSEGTIIAYAAAPGAIALDGESSGRNSPFTTSLLRWMREPAIEILTMFRRVTNDVVTQTGGRQRPEFGGDLTFDFYLDPLADRRTWERIRGSSDQTLLREFMTQFPNSIYRGEAAKRLEILESARREALVCRRERDELGTIGNDLAKLQAFAQRASCDETKGIVNKLIGAILAQRELEGQRAEVRRREEAARLRNEVCRNESATVGALSDDLSKLQAFAQQATCDEARKLASERMKDLLARQEVEDRRRREVERICRTESDVLTTVWNDLEKLQSLRSDAACEQVRVTAAERAKNLAAQREREVAETRRRAEEAKRQAALDEDRRAKEAARLAEEERKAAEARRRAEQAKRQEVLEAERKAKEAARRLEEERKAAEARRLADEARRQEALEAERKAKDLARRAEDEREKAARACENERVASASVWDDIAKLRAFKASCAELRPAIAARVETLEAAQREVEAKQKQAAERLAALEEERNRQRREEEQRRRLEAEQAQALQRCKEEQVALAALGVDLGKLRAFAKTAGCQEVRALTVEKVALIEREEKVCATEDSRRNGILRLVRGVADRKRLTVSRDSMLALEQNLVCDRLRSSVTAALTSIRVQIAQVELRRHGCYIGALDGAWNEVTRGSVNRFLANLGRPEIDSDVTDDVLSMIIEQQRQVCPPPPVAARPERNRPEKKETKRPAKVVREAPARPAPRPSRQAERPQAAPPPAAPAGGGGRTGGGTMTGVGF